MSFPRVSAPARPFLALIAFISLSLIATACTSSKGASGASGTTTAASGPLTSGAAASSDDSSAAASPTPVPTVSGNPVHISSVEDDGTTWGVGMPIILLFNVAPKSSAEFLKATTVTVNGVPADGAWYFEDSITHAGQVMEAHYRPQKYWPANAKIVMTAKTKGVSAGDGLYFDNDFSIDMATSDARVGTVDANTLQLTVTNNGAVWGTFPVSLGADKTRTSTAPR